jgi:recombination protein RecA
MAKKRVEEVDENEGLMAKLRSIAPKGEDAGSWEISRTTDLVLSEVKYVFTTGIDAFDDIAGGIPIGRMGELYGLESCGKTAMAIRCAARAMKKHVCEIVRNKDDTTTLRPLKPEECKVVVVYIDNEQSLDDDLKLVVDGEKLDVIGCRFDTTDDVFKAIDGAISYQEDRLEMEEKDGIKRFMLIVVDTIASTSTKQELEQKWGTQDFPRQPQQISKALRQLVRRVNRFNVAVIFTNQVRIKFQGGQAQKQTFAIQADDYTSPGGMALRFYTTHRVFMYALNQKYRLLPDAQFSAGLLVGFFTKKNRLRPPLRDGRMVLLFDKHQGGLNNVFSILETLVFLGFVEVAAETKHTGYSLKFKKHGIIPTTFDAAKVETTLEEDEDLPAPRRGSSRKDPGFFSRSEWPHFYEDHKTDIDKLWAAAMAYAMATEGLEGGIQIIEEETPAPLEAD